MLISEAYAQAGSAAGAPDPTTAILMNVAPLIAIVVIFYFLLIRPQQRRMKAHQDMISAVKKGDVVVTSGGLIGKVKGVADDELRVELAPNVEVRVERSAISNVRNKGEPAPANDSKSGKTAE